ncbi:MAG: protein N-lysine methyltransferase family protein [Gemmatimonadota bacterium]|nr:protein N-lysine methyltransferase family protein [Gemmatimonadota bacterium]
MTGLRGARLVASLSRRFVTVNDDVRVGDRELNVLRPRSAEDLISETDFERDERLPYWAELWPSSTILANFIVADVRPRGRLVELGAGVGLVSVAAAAVGHDVTATDYYEDALLFARANSFRNLGYEIRTELLDWRNVPDAFPWFDTVLASDVLYESRYAPLVAGVIERLLAPDGVAYVADPGRVATNAFVDACNELRMSVDVRAERPYQAGKIRQSITVYEVKRI